MEQEKKERGFKMSRFLITLSDLIFPLDHEDHPLFILKKKEILKFYRSNKRAPKSHAEIGLVKKVGQSQTASSVHTHTHARTHTHTHMQPTSPMDMDEPLMQADTSTAPGMAPDLAPETPDPPDVPLTTQDLRYMHVSPLFTCPIRVLSDDCISELEKVTDYAKIKGDKRVDMFAEALPAGVEDFRDFHAAWSRNESRCGFYLWLKFEFIL